MKRYLSLVLAFALILTTIVLPMSASAAEDPTITVSLALTDSSGNALVDNKAYAGDTVTLTVSAVSDTAETAIAGSNIIIKFDGNLFDGAVAPTYVYDAGSLYANAGDLSWYTAANLELGTTATTIFTATYTMKDVGTGSDAFVLQDDSSFTDANGTDYLNWPATTATADIGVQPGVMSATVTNGGDATPLVVGSGKTFWNSTEILVTPVISEGVFKKATLEKKDIGAADNTYTAVSDTEWANGVYTSYSLGTLGSGDYRVTVAAKGQEDQVYTFTYRKETPPAGKLDIVADLSAAGYTPGSTFAVPVYLKDIGENVAGMLSFEVEYDGTKLDLVETGSGDNVTFNEYKNKDTADASVTVVYGDGGADGNLANNALAATLNFKVKDGITAWGNTTIALDTQGHTWVNKSGYDTTGSSLGVEDGSVTTTIVSANPTTDYVNNVTTTAARNETGWANKAYKVQFTDANDGVNLAWYASDDTVASATVDNYSDANVVTNEFDVTDGTKNYYLIAKVGSNPAVYQIAYELTENAAKLDTVKPVVLAQGEAPAASSTISANGEVYFTLPLAQISETGSNIDVSAVKIEISNGEFITAEADATDGYKFKVTGESAETVKISVTDIAGNVSDETENSTYVVNLDGKLPTVSAEEGKVVADGGRNIDITASDDADNGYASGLKEVKIVKVTQQEGSEPVETDVETIKADQFTDGKYSYKVSNSGTYKVYAYDNVNNVNSTDGVVITVGLVDPTPLLAAITTTGAPKAGFEASTATQEIDNGTFNYVKLAVAEDTNEYTHKITWRKGSKDTDPITVEENAVTGDTLTTTETKNGKYYVTVTTTEKGNDVNTNSKTYVFHIVGTQLDMLSANNDNKFNMVDYIRIRNLGTTGETPMTFELAGQKKFEAGLYSADVDGSISYSSADLELILKNMRNGRVKGHYDYPFLNSLTETITTDNNTPVVSEGSGE